MQSNYELIRFNVRLHSLSSKNVTLALSYLFSIMRDWLQDGAEGLEANGDVHEMHGEEEGVEVAQHRHQEVPRDVQERL